MRFPSVILLRRRPPSADSERRLSREHPSSFARRQRAFRRAGPLLLLAAAAALGSCREQTPLERLDEARLAESFERLHRRVYEVYGLPLDRDAIHRLLDSSFAGEALTDEYVEHYTTRVRMEREGTAIDVLRVDYEQVAVVERAPQQVLVQADWSVGGVVSHQRHKHPRVNRYRAVFALAPTAPAAPEEPGELAAVIEGLRIVETRLQRLERVKSAFEGGRGGFPLDDLPSSAGGFLSTQELLESGVLDELEVEGDAATEDGAGEGGEGGTRDGDARDAGAGPPGELR